MFLDFDNPKSNISSSNSSKALSSNDDAAVVAVLLSGVMEVGELLPLLLALAL